MKSTTSKPAIQRVYIQVSDPLLKTSQTFTIYGKTIPQVKAALGVKK